jgi:hypothetical protein
MLSKITTVVLVIAWPKCGFKKKQSCNQGAKCLYINNIITSPEIGRIYVTIFMAGFCHLICDY